MNRTRSYYQLIQTTGFTGENTMNICPHCKDEVTPWLCPICNVIIDDVCNECHKEVKHGRILPPKGNIVRIKSKPLQHKDRA